MEGVANYGVPLSAAEIQARAACELVIEHGFRTFYEVGAALLQIRDQRLYRVSHTSFEEYCRQRWGLQKRRVYQLVEAATIVDDLKKCTTVHLPENERQARALVAVEPELRPVVMQAAAAIAPNGSATTAHIEQAKREIVVPSATARPLVDDEPASAPNPLFTSDSPEWYTPRHILDRVVDFFDVIDLDPCSNSLRDPNVPAEHHYTSAEDGLTQDWFGRVYMNPPYGSRIIDPWIAKAITSYKTRRIEAAIALVPNRTDTVWFQPLWEYPLCFVRGRLKFYGPGAATANSATFGSVIALIGTDIDEFRRWFGDLGHIVVEHEVSRKEPA